MLREGGGHTIHWLSKTGSILHTLVCIIKACVSLCMYLSDHFHTYSSTTPQVVALVLSDVIGDPLDLIASGPTVRDHSTPKQCLELFKKLGVTDKLPKRY